MSALAPAQVIFRSLAIYGLLLNLLLFAVHTPQALAQNLSTSHIDHQLVLCQTELDGSSHPAEKSDHHRFCPVCLAGSLPTLAVVPQLVAPAALNTPVTYPAVASLLCAKSIAAPRNRGPPVG